MAEEIWKPIPNTGKAYWVSNHGRVRSHLAPPGKGRGKWVILDEPQRFLSTNARSGRYPCVYLGRHGNARPHCVHRLVMEAFIGPCPDGYIVCHKDDDPTNNHLDNLRYDTYAGNIQDAIDNGAQFGPRTFAKGQAQGTSPTVGHNISLRQHQWDLLKTWADQSGLSLSQVVRAIVRDYTLEGGNMADKLLRIDADLHKRIKLAATMADQSMKDWVEAVLADALDKRLIDTREQYTTKGADND